MVQYIQLIRTKQTDIYALYLIEFLKFVGCIFTEYVYHDSKSIEDEFCRTPDATIFLDISREKIGRDLAFEEAKRDFDAKVDSKRVDLEIPFGGSDQNGMISFNKEIAGTLLDQMIGKIWEGEEVQEEIRLLKRIYLDSDSFFYLYNEGNIKFVEDYYPVSGEENKAVVIRREAYNKSFDHFANCYNQLMEEKEKAGTVSPHFVYALLLIKYKLNEMTILLDKRNLFLIDKLIEQIEEIREKNPDFVRMEYLAGSICKREKRYWDNAAGYYKRAVLKFEKRKEMEPKWIGFIYYQLGRFYESKLNDLKLANSFYEKSVQRKTYYRPIFKLLRQAEREGDVENVKKYANQLIAQLLNGYEISSVMPKERIYAFKNFYVFGRFYFEREEYDLARQCYERAKQVSEGDCDFYKAFLPEENRCFFQIFKSCMPVQPVLSRLKDCYSKLGRIADAERCWEEQKNME